MADDVTAAVDDGMTTGRKIWLVVGGLAAIALVLFIVQNNHEAPVNFLWWEGDVRLWLLLIITVLLTLVVAVVGIWIMNRRSRS